MPTRRSFLAQAATAAAASLFSPTTLRAQATPPAPIKIGQIGTGHAHAAGKLEAIRQSPAFDLVGVVEPDASRRQRAEKQSAYAGVRWLTEEALLSTPGLQAVAVETEVRELVPTALRCVRAGQHLHMDKPGGESLPAYRELRQEAAQRKLIIQMGYMLRYNPGVQLCYQLARDGWLGEIFSIEAAMSKLLVGAERTRLTSYRGGSMFELGCHVLDSAVYLLGKPMKVTGFSRATTADGWQDNQTAVLEYPRATATLRSTMAEVEGGSRRHFTVCGTEGTVEVLPLEPGHTPRVALRKARAPYKAGYQTVTLPKPTGRYDGEFAALAASIRGEAPFPFSPEHDLAVHEALLQASGLPLT